MVLLLQQSRLNAELLRSVVGGGGDPQVLGRSAAAAAACCGLRSKVHRVGLQMHF